MDIPDRQLYIDGKWIRPVQGQIYDVYSPATAEKIGTIPSATAEDVDRAVVAANKTFRSGVWSKQSGAHRAKFLRAIAEKVRSVLVCSKCSMHQLQLLQTSLLAVMQITRSAG